MKCDPERIAEGFDEINQNIETILDHVEIDEIYRLTVRKMLKYVIYLALGWEARSIRKALNAGEIETSFSWNNVLAYISELLGEDNWPIPRDYHAFWYGNVLSASSGRMIHKIEYITRMNECAVLDVCLEGDDSPEGKLGLEMEDVGARSGYKLLSILPEQDNSLMTVFKMALLEVSALRLTDD